MTLALKILETISEHYESCVLHVYEGVDGIPTIGWGNTFWENGTPVRLTDKPITQVRADQLYEFWIFKFLADIKKLAPEANDNQLAALADLAYNIGEGNFKNSSALRAFLAGDFDLAGKDIELWIMSRGVVEKGLQRRRRAGHMIFDGSDVQAAIDAAELAFP